MPSSSGTHCPNESCLWLECACLVCFGIFTSILPQFLGSWELFKAPPSVSAAFCISLAGVHQHLPFLKDAPWSTFILTF